MQTIRSYSSRLAHAYPQASMSMWALAYGDEGKIRIDFEPKKTKEPSYSSPVTQTGIFTRGRGHDTGI